MPRSVLAVLAATLLLAVSSLWLRGPARARLELAAGERALAAGAYAQAEAHLARAAALDPGDPRIEGVLVAARFLRWVEEGRAALAGGAYPQALAALEQAAALSRRPDGPLGTLLQAARERHARWTRECSAFARYAEAVAPVVYGLGAVAEEWDGLVRRAAADEAAGAHAVDVTREVLVPELARLERLAEGMAPDDPALRALHDRLRQALALRREGLQAVIEAYPHRDARHAAGVERLRAAMGHEAWLGQVFDRLAVYCQLVPANARR